MTDTALNDGLCCTVCRRPIPAWDMPRHACQDCQQRTAGQLAELPALYAALDAAPSRGAPLVGSHHAAAGSRPPVRLDVVDLAGRRGAVLSVLTGWIRVWHEDGGGDLPDWPTGEVQQVTACCRWLRWHLDWAARQHEAVTEAMTEIRDTWRHVHAAATGERGDRRVTVQCGCGGLLRVGVSTPTARCHTCGTQYGHTEALSLPLAERSAAA